MESDTLMLFANHAGSVEYVARLVFFALLVVCVVRPAMIPMRMRSMSLRVWVSIVAIWMILYAAVLTVAQYLIWIKSDVTRELVQTPLSAETPRLLLHAPIFPFVDGTHGYYVFYAYTHFWMPVLLAFASAGLVYGLFAFLRKRKPVAVAHEEIALAAGGALLTGWPHMLIFISLAFLLATIHTLTGRVRYGGEARTRMLHALILAGLVTLTLGVYVGAQVGIGAMVV